MRSRLVAIAISTAFCLLVGLWLAVTPPALAGGCAHTYRVMWGDTLSGIAARFGATVPDLARLNGIRDPDRIYAGQTLCLPDGQTPAVPSPAGAPASTSPVPAVGSPAAVAPAPAAPQPKIVLEASYVFTPIGDETKSRLAQARRLGKRVVYPLAGPGALQRVTDTRGLLALVSDADLPRLWLARTEAGYTLVSLGPGEPLAAVRISDTQTTTPFVAVPDPLDCPTATVATAGDPDPNLRLDDLTLWVESADGIRYPFPVAAIAHAENMDQIGRCFADDAYLALLPPLPAEPDAYRAILVATQDDFPAPGSGTAANCELWRTGGWFFRLWYGLQGCAP
ncbi:MAG: hypothetical protein AUK03_01475 [Anaerolineae bacterium CG2_30_64_16]|nr:MAG: hypothetical protein AUK03_01475 [Anaerolineae bacterium CG2_30_64_16]